MMCLRLAMELSDRVAAVCVNCGSVAADSDYAEPRLPVSLLYCMGTADPIMPFNGGYVNVNPPASGTVSAASATIALWTNAFAIPPVPEITNTFPDLVTTDHSTVIEYDYQRAQSGAELVYLQINGGGYGWPAPTQFPLVQILANGRKNQDIFLCDVVWEFFQRHTQDGPPLRLSSSRAGASLQLRWDWGLLQVSSDLVDWNELAASSPTNVPMAGPTCFFRFKSP